MIIYHVLSNCLGGEFSSKITFWVPLAVKQMKNLNISENNKMFCYVILSHFNKDIYVSIFLTRIHKFATM